MSAKRPARQPRAITAAKRRELDFASVGLQPEAANLAFSRDVEITFAGQARQSHPDGAKVRENSIRRLDAFEALRQGMETGAYDAARRLERDIAVSLGEHDKGRFLERVDNAKDADRTDAMIAAAIRVDNVLAKIGRRDAWLLFDLIAMPPRFDTWRDIVAHITGETNAVAQCAAVRAACANLKHAYEQA